MIDIDGDRKKDSITFYKRKRAGGHVANVDLSTAVKLTRGRKKKSTTKKKTKRRRRRVALI